jgi:LmbE family N-acetylglucosaminyl deacetylase
MKILAIGAHPDDIEIFMYGFISACKKRGDEIFLAIATDGSAGGNSKEIELIDLRKKETKQGLALLGDPLLMGFKDGYLIQETNALSTIKRHISSIKPDLILTHDPKDYHPDHRALSRLVTEAASFISPVLFADTLMGVGFVPEIYIDITMFFKEKENAILFHKSQNPQKFLDATRILNGFRASQCNAPKGNFAETYRFEPHFPFGDIRSLLPSSMIPRPFYQNLEKSLI